MDILHHGLSVYSAEIDAHVRELGRLMDFRQLSEFLNSLTGLAIAEIGSRIKEQVLLLRSEGKDRGWEID